MKRAGAPGTRTGRPDGGAAPGSPPSTRGDSEIDRNAPQDELVSATDESSLQSRCRELQQLNAVLNGEVIRLRQELAGLRAARRQPLPLERPSITHKFGVAGYLGYVTIGLYPDTGRPGELFIVIAKQGSTIGGLLDAFGRAASLALQYGMPIEDFVRKFRGFSFEPMGWTGNPEIPFATSIVDYIVRWIGMRFSVPAECSPQAELPLQPAGRGSDPMPPSTTPRDSRTPALPTSSDGPPCPRCGSRTRRVGSGYGCPSCGTTLEA